MNIREKSGVVVFLDALGARTIDISFSADYLNKLEEFKNEIVQTKKIIRTAEDAFDKNKAIWRPKRLKFRFFGDSVLITYAVNSERELKRVMLGVYFLICNFICLSLKMGILFRGALSVGKYLETKDVMLGPAITDAANWYDQPDFIGVMLTPSTTNLVKSIYRLGSKTDQVDVESPHPSLLLYEVPISKRSVSRGSEIQAYAVNWPGLIDLEYAPEDKKDRLLWFYNRVKALPVPVGAETKYSNTEAFIKESIKAAARRALQVHSNEIRNIIPEPQTPKPKAG
jgi:hypothetical protein